MKRSVVLCFLMMLSWSVFAQEQKKSGNEGTGEVFTVVEKMPEYPGGQEALVKYLTANFSYPETAKMEQKEGTVYVQFVVDTDGTIINAKVLRGIHSDCDAEALRVVNSMPKWNPGTQSGKSVKVMYNLPIRFALN